MLSLGPFSGGNITPQHCFAALRTTYNYSIGGDGADLATACSFAAKFSEVVEIDSSQWLVVPYYQ
jgi:hypothetical protein